MREDSSFGRRRASVYHGNADAKRLHGSSRGSRRCGHISAPFAIDGEFEQRCVMPTIHDIPEESNKSETQSENGEAEITTLTPKMSVTVTTMPSQRPNIFDKLPEAVRNNKIPLIKSPLTTIQEDVEGEEEEEAQKKRIPIQRIKLNTQQLNHYQMQQQGEEVPNQQIKFTIEQKIQTLNQILKDKRVGRTQSTEDQVAKLQKIMDRHKIRCSQKLSIVNIVFQPKTHNTQTRSNLSMQKADLKNTRQKSQVSKLKNKQKLTLSEKNPHNLYNR